MGLVICRCPYDDDAAWARFKKRIEKRSREAIAESEMPKAAHSPVWTFVEDRESLDCASKDTLRIRFRQWATEAIRTVQTRVEHHESFGVP